MVPQCIPVESNKCIMQHVPSLNCFLSLPCNPFTISASLCWSPSANSSAILENEPERDQRYTVSNACAQCSKEQRWPMHNVSIHMSKQTFDYICTSGLSFISRLLTRRKEILCVSVGFQPSWREIEPEKQVQTKLEETNIDLHRV